MMNEGRYDWPGKSGEEYLYRVYRLPCSFRPVPGNYIFAAETPPWKWTPIYIGETEDLSEHLDDHQAMLCIREYPATHIHVHANDGDQVDRCSEEQDLIARWNPPCNGYWVVPSEVWYQLAGGGEQTKLYLSLEAAKDGLNQILSRHEAWATE